MFSTIKARVFPDPVDDLSVRKSGWDKLRLGLFIAGFLAALIAFSVYDSLNPITSVKYDNKPIRLDAIVVASGPDHTCISGTVKDGSEETQHSSSSSTSTYDTTITGDDGSLKFDKFGTYFAIARNMPESFTKKSIVIVDECVPTGGAVLLVSTGVDPSTVVERFSRDAVRPWPEAVYYGLGMNSLINVRREDTVSADGERSINFEQNIRFAEVATITSASLLMETKYVEYKYQTRAGLLKRIIVDAGSTLSAAGAFSLIVLWGILRCRYSERDAWVSHALREDILVTMKSVGRRSSSPDAGPINGDRA